VLVACKNVGYREAVCWTTRMLGFHSAARMLGFHSAARMLGVHSAARMLGVHSATRRREQRSRCVHLKPITLQFIQRRVTEFMVSAFKADHRASHCTVRFVTGLVQLGTYMPNEMHTYLQCCVMRCGMQWKCSETDRS
jgi:hypothetical protein